MSLYDNNDIKISNVFPTLIFPASFSFAMS